MRVSHLLTSLAAVALLVTACTQDPADVATMQTSSELDRAAAGPTPSATMSAQNQLSPKTEATASPTASATVDPKAKVIYLTFDDGPWVPYTQQLLDVLEKHDVTATFFVVGEMAREYPQLIKKIAAAGHAIGNHTWSHPMLTTLGDAEVRAQLDRTADAVGRDVMGACMRPPYGDTNDRVRGIAQKLGYKTVLWTHWAMDWEQPPVPELLDYLRAASKDRANILLHDGGGDRPNTIKAVDVMLPRWIKKGFTFRSVPSCRTPLA